MKHGASARQCLMVTGGAGFIGSAVVRYLIAETECRIVNVDRLTYAGNLASVAPVADDPRYAFERVDICDADAIRRIFADYDVDAVIHLAAESHVDRSIDTPAEFVQTNVVGTFTLLQEARRHWLALPRPRRDAFRFLHVSTDEVFGSLGASGAFDERTPYAPRSPYSASKAGSDHLVRAWHETYGLPCLVTNCSNNYGPYQFPEKLIPVTILNAVAGQPLPVYGRGDNVRDWLFVDDHARALTAVLRAGVPGETYNVGGSSERTNLEVVRAICGVLDELAPSGAIGPHESLIQFVADRPGHDFRYAIDATKLRRETGWAPRETFDSGLRATVAWYLANGAWCETVQAGGYRRERVGLGAGATGAA